LTLPGWVRRPPELTPPLRLDRSGAAANGPDLATLQDPANEVAFKMIGGAYGVLGAEVLGQFVPRAVDEQRFGVYVREAAVAWLCRELAPHIKGDSVSALPFRMARCVAAHHFVHYVVEAAVTQAHGEAAYLDLVVRHSPRHLDLEECLAEQRFLSEALSDLDLGTSQLLQGPLSVLMARAPEATDPASPANADDLLELLNTELLLGMTAADSDFHRRENSVPTFLVIEPHLPDPLAYSIRRALVG
jgi:hypothetical protein